MFGRQPAATAEYPAPEASLARRTREACPSGTWCATAWAGPWVAPSIPASQPLRQARAAKIWQTVNSGWFAGPARIRRCGRA